MSQIERFEGLANMLKLLMNQLISYEVYTFLVIVIWRDVFSIYFSQKPLIAYK
jgi:hypothetical protein